MINTLLITGCSYGLGRSLAMKFAKNNYHVYAVGRSEKLLIDLAKTSSNIIPIVADISTENGRLIISKYVDTNKSLSIIHNASIADPCQFQSMSESLLRKHVEVNFLAPLLITQNLLPLITKGQRILNITSAAADMAIPGLMTYCTTKAAMQLAIQCLKVEMNSNGIFCANLRPGLIDTPMGANLRNADINVLPNRDFYLKLKNENKLISPETVADFVFWVMLKTNDVDFISTAWNIYDEVHHGYWLPRGAQKPVTA